MRATACAIADRLVGYGVLGSLAHQRAVEIVDSEAASDDALELAQEFFATLGKGAVLVEDLPGLFLGRTVGSIVNEAMIAVHEQIASPDDIDTAHAARSKLSRRADRMGTRDRRSAPDAHLAAARG